MTNPVSDQQGIPTSNTPVLVSRNGGVSTRASSHGNWSSRFGGSVSFASGDRDDMHRPMAERMHTLPGSELDNIFNPVWYKFFNYLWKMVGGGSGAGIPSDTATTKVSGDNVLTTPLSQQPTATGASQAPAAPVVTSPPPPAGASLGAPQVIGTGGASPFAWSAPGPGTAIVTAAQVELSRDAVFWTMVSPMGGAVPVKTGDQLRLTWFGASAPSLTFFPG